MLPSKPLLPTGSSWIPWKEGSTTTSQLRDFNISSISLLKDLLASEELKVTLYQKDIVTILPCVHVIRQSQVSLHTAFMCFGQLEGIETVLGKTIQKLDVTPVPISVFSPTCSDDHLSPRPRKVYTDSTEVLHCSKHISKCLSSSHLSSLRAITLRLPQVGPHYSHLFQSTWASGIHWLNQGRFLIQTGLGNSPFQWVLDETKSSSFLSELSLWMRMLRAV